ncbi:MAG: glycosyltransferase family 4 protein [Bacteroidaceae bacterium]|nr:glycosyltransferase family 4 protein [Bacteroidaceae bacterium]
MGDVKVLIGNEAFDAQTHGGVTRCFCELMRRMPSSVETQVGVLTTENVYLRQMGVPSLDERLAQMPLYSPSLRKLFYKIYKRGVGIRCHQPFAGKRTSPNAIYNCYLVGRQDYDVYHPTFFDQRFLRHIGRKPFVLTVHDMIVELFRDKYVRSDNQQIVDKAALIPLASHIVAVSECTKRDLMDLFHVPEERITVIYHGSDEQPTTFGLQSPIDAPYLLYVGQRYENKQFDRFVEGSADFLRAHPEVKVVCTSVGFNKEELALLDRLHLKDRFVHRFVADDSELMSLYHHALAFVYPSLYEGFGIPILEAYQAACPVMLNHASCFPEIAGDAAIYFHLDGEHSDLTESLTQMYAMTADERKTLIDKQRERLSRFSWQRSAEQLAEVYLRFRP